MLLLSCFLPLLILAANPFRNGKSNERLDKNTLIQRLKPGVEFECTLEAFENFLEKALNDNWDEQEISWWFLKCMDLPGLENSTFVENCFTTSSIVGSGLIPLVIDYAPQPLVLTAVMTALSTIRSVTTRGWKNVKLLNLNDAEVAAAFIQMQRMELTSFIHSSRLLIAPFLTEAPHGHPVINSLVKSGVPLITQSTRAPFKLELLCVIKLFPDNPLAMVNGPWIDSMQLHLYDAFLEVCEARGIDTAAWMASQTPLIQSLFNLVKHKERVTDQFLDELFVNHGNALSRHVSFLRFILRYRRDWGARAIPTSTWTALMFTCDVSVPLPHQMPPIMDLFPPSIGRHISKITVLRHLAYKYGFERIYDGIKANAHLFPNGFLEYFDHNVILEERPECKHFSV